MKNEKSKIIAVLIFSIMVFTSASPVLGAFTSTPGANRVSENGSTGNTAGNGEENGSGENGNQNGEVLRERIKDRSNQEIERRINALNKASLRLQSMERISEETKSQLENTIQSQISQLNVLKNNIEKEEDVEDLLGYKKSITNAYRIYALVIPQGAIVAASDRVETISASMETISEKLNTRIQSEKEKGVDTQNMESLLEEINSEIANAKTYAEEAVNMVSELSPDNGDEEGLQANIETLKEARDKIKEAHQELINAKQNVREIINELRDLIQTSEIEVEE